MAKDAIYEGRREVRTYVALAHGIDVLIHKTGESKRGSFYTNMSALILSAFTFEAYLNHLGSMKIKFWDEIEAVRIMNKYKVLCKEFDIEPKFSKRPYQTLSSLIRSRNLIAHGRSEVIEETKAVSSREDPHKHAPKTWIEKFCTIKNTHRVREDLINILTELNDKAGLGKYPFINGMTVASIKLKQS